MNTEDEDQVSAARAKARDELNKTLEPLHKQMEANRAFNKWAVENGVSAIEEQENQFDDDALARIYEQTISMLLSQKRELQTEVDAFKDMWAKFKSVEENDEKGMLKATYEASAGIMGLIGRHCQVVLDEFNALNYVQLSFDDPELNKSFIVIVARSEEQTPHELREKALERVKELEAKLAQYEKAI